MQTKILNKEEKLKSKIISDYTFEDEETVEIPKWQMEELDKTEEKIKNWEIKYINSDKFDKSILDYIKNLYSNDSKACIIK